MALTEQSGGIPATMLVGPTGVGTGYPVYANNGSSMGGFGGDGWWIILLIILLAGGWNNGGMGGYGNGDFPWLMTGQQNINTNTNNGFRDAMINDGITSIRDGISGLSTQLCGCCSDMQMALANGFSGVEQGANARQIANMQQAFANQTAMTQGFSSVQSQLADCCCENRLASADLKYTIATENCADRTAATQNTRDIIDSQTRGTQAILDKLCQLELDGVKAQVEAKNDRIGELQTQLNMANLAASQTAQNAFIAQGFANEVDQLYNRLNSCPVPTTPVYGRTPIFTCNQQNGCNCGGNTFYN